MKKSKPNREEILKPALGSAGTLVLSTFFFLTGISGGIFLELLMSPAQKNEVARYLLQYLSLESSAMNYPNPLVASLLSNLLLLLIFFLSGLTIYGFPVAFLTLLYKGFALGFSTCLIIEALSFKGLFIILMAIIPQNLLLVPALILASAGAVNYALLKISKRREFKRGSRGSNREIHIGPYCLFFSFPLILIIVGCLIESLLFPIVISP